MGKPPASAPKAPSPSVPSRVPRDGAVGSTDGRRGRSADAKAKGPPLVINTLNVDDPNLRRSPGFGGNAQNPESDYGNLINDGIAAKAPPPGLPPPERRGVNAVRPPRLFQL